MINQCKVNVTRPQWELKKTRQVKKQPDAWTWPSITIGFCFGRDWLREYHESLRPFLKQREANPTQSRITFASRLKIAPRSPHCPKWYTSGVMTQLGFWRISPVFPFRLVHRLPKFWLSEHIWTCFRRKIDKTAWMHWSKASRWSIWTTKDFRRLSALLLCRRRLARTFRSWKNWFTARR